MADNVAFRQPRRSLLHLRQGQFLDLALELGDALVSQVHRGAWIMPDTALSILFFSARPGDRNQAPVVAPGRLLPRPPLACRQSVRYILNRMVQYTSARLDASFAALSDATRRGVLEQLGRADASITDLAERFHMTLTGMKKHVGVLEQAGLVTTEKVGRVRTCKLGRRRVEEETAWIARHRQLWASRFDELDGIVEELKRKETVEGRKRRK